MPVASMLDYRRAHAAAMIGLGITMTVSAEQPAPYVEGWKWCIVCPDPACDNRPMVGWGIACCFDCGTVCQGLVLPDEAAEIERILAFRPKLSQRSWLTTETLADLEAQNVSIGVPIL
jgi:hypothetical protein